jgi:hypothetical protein
MNERMTDARYDQLCRLKNNILKSGKRSGFEQELLLALIAERKALKAANDFATTLTGTHPDDIHKSRDERIGRLENRLRFGVSLPKITPELREEFSEACWLINAGGWSQDAVDFACVLNATLREQADNV